MFSRFFVQSQQPLIPAVFGRRFIHKIPIRNQINRQLHREGRDTIARTEENSQRQTLEKKINVQARSNAFGQGTLIGGSVLGLGALCFYGLGMSKNASTIMNNSMIWPQYVRDRVHDTYAYFGSSIAITAASATAVFRTPALMNIFARSSWISMIATIALMMGSGIVAQSIPYKKGFGLKQLAWGTHCAIMGAVLAPISIVGGPVLIRAAWYTAGIIGGLSTVAICAPNDRFLHMGGPLAIGLGVVFASSVGSMFLPVTTALGAGLYSISLYGGLVLFSTFLLYDTQRIVHKAENHPVNAMQPFDPINESISIYTNTLNIFIRIVNLLMAQENKKRKRQ